MYLNKQQILGATDRGIDDVCVPEWAPPDVDPATCIVRVKRMSAKQRDAFEASMVQSGSGGKPNLTNLRARLCAMVMVDEQGIRMFSDEEVNLLGERSFVALERVYTVATKASAVGDGAVRDLAKNSSADQSESSPSISASP